MLMTTHRSALDLAPIARLPLDRLVPSLNNRHSSDDEPDTLSLAESLRHEGQLQPIIVRSNADDGTFQILAGERRWRAARIAGFDTIEAKVIACDDHQALAITVIENLQRKNPHPLEEARGIRRLIDDGTLLDEIAANLGKSQTWVASRAQLTQLAQSWTTDNGDLAWASVGHWEIIARLPTEVQDDLAKDSWFHAPSIKELDKLIKEKYLNLLKSAPWKLDDAELSPAAGSCTACAKRSACQQLLFGDQVGATDRCLDVGCWAVKTTATAKRNAEKLAAKHDVVAVLVSNRHGSPGNTAPRDLPDQAKVVDDSWHLKRVNKSTPGAIPAVEAETGRTVWIKPEKYTDETTRKVLGCAVEKSSATRPKSSAASGDNAAVNAARREAKRIKLRIAAITEALDARKRPELMELLRLAMGFLVDEEDLCDPKIWEYVTGKTDQEAVLEDLWGHVRESLGRIEYKQVQSTSLPDLKGLAAFEIFVGLKPADQAMTALAEIPDPKPRNNQDAAIVKSQSKGKAKKNQKSAVRL